MTTHSAATTAIAALSLAGGTAAALSAARPAPARPAIVVDAAQGRSGRELLDPRLAATRATVRLPRTAAEARTNVRYLRATGHDPVIVVGGDAQTAAGQGAVAADGLDAALAALRR